MRSEQLYTVMAASTSLCFEITWTDALTLPESTRSSAPWPINGSHCSVRGGAHATSAAVPPPAMSRVNRRRGLQAPGGRLTAGLQSSLTSVAERARFLSPLRKAFQTNQRDAARTGY